MKAAVFSQYGGPQVLQVQEVEKPVPQAHEILVRIQATAVNSGDVRLRKADPFAVRFMLGLTRPRITILGGVFSGRVEAVGSSVTRFQVGDEVFGSTDLKFGAYAAYKCFPETGTLARKPAHVSHPEAAVIPFGGTTALYFLRKAGIKPGQKVLIYGASGAVGAAAVQLAKYYGATVTAVCSTANVEWVRALGADRVMDYTQEDFLLSPDTWDVVYDTVNKVSVKAALRKLNPGGTLILGAAGLGQMLSAALRTLLGSRKACFGMIRQTPEDIRFLAERVQEGSLRPVIDRSYPLEQIAEAHAYVDQGHKKGNVAITVD